MINGVHALIYTPQAEAVRAFLRDKVGWSSVDAGGGWLIFGLPPAELGVHPTGGASQHELYLMCDDIEATVAELTGRGVEFAGGIFDEDFGRVAMIKLPDGGGELGLYQPRHPTALHLGSGAVPADPIGSLRGADAGPGPSSEKAREAARADEHAPP